MKTSTILLKLALLAFGYGLQFGPCQDVTTVEVDNEQWESAGGLYVNIQSLEEGVHCGWVYHYLTHEDSGKVFLGFYLKRMQDDIKKALTWSGDRVGPGHYISSSQLIEGRNSTIHTYFLYFDPPNLICHFTCTDDPYFHDVKGGFFCEGPTPDAPLNNAAVIRQVAEDNGFTLEKLMVVDNCKTNHKCNEHIPFEHGANSNCKNDTIHQYLDL